MKIVYLKNIDIDKVLWDNCVKKSNSNLIYGLSIFLDTMAPNWEALIVNDYEAVMPIPIKKKFGIKYIPYVAFAQQLGLFSTNNEIRFEEVLAFLKKHINYGHLSLNLTQQYLNNSEVRTNFILRLNKTYEEIYKCYKNDLKKNLKLAQKKYWEFSNDLRIEEAIKMYRIQYSHKHPELKDKEYKNLQNLCNKLSLDKKIFTRCVINTEKKIESIALFFFHDSRIYNVLNTTTEQGRVNSANHYLLNKVIEEFSESNCIFDFEGSDLPGVKDFYKKFSPINEPYFIYKYNNLPFPLNLFKK